MNNAYILITAALAACQYSVDTKSSFFDEKGLCVTQLSDRPDCVSKHDGLCVTMVGDTKFTFSKSDKSLLQKSSNLSLDIQNYLSLDANADLNDVYVAVRDSGKFTKNSISMSKNYQDDTDEFPAEHIMQLKIENYAVCKNGDSFQLSVLYDEQGELIFSIDKF